GRRCTDTFPSSARSWPLSSWRCLVGLLRHSSAGGTRAMSRSGSEVPVTQASIVVKDLSLVVPYYAQPEEAPSSSWLATLFGAATAVPRRRFATLLDKVSFSISEGERVALIGRNGAGKSTLLRTMAGAFQPSGGRMEIAGSRQALLSVGLGFNKEATVQEN